MSLTRLAVILAGIWIIIYSQTAPSEVLSLIFGIVIVAFVLFDNRDVLLNRT
jgi:hypothetical protein